MEIIVLLVNLINNKIQKSAIQYLLKKNVLQHFDKDTREELFYEIQRQAERNYSEGYKGLATKEFLEQTYIGLAEIMKMLDYDIYPNGLVTMIRLY